MQGRSPELQPLENAGYELIYARPVQTPTEDELLTDVFQIEPPDPASPLLRHDRVIASPHIGAFTEESVQRATQKAVENLLNALA